MPLLVYTVRIDRLAGDMLSILPRSSTGYSIVNCRQPSPWARNRKATLDLSICKLISTLDCG